MSWNQNHECYNHSIQSKLKYTPDNPLNQSKLEAKKIFWLDGNVLRDLLANHYYIIKIVRASDKKSDI